MKNLPPAAITTSTVTVSTKKRTKRTTTATATTATTATATTATSTATTATVPTRKRTKKITTATATTTAQRSFARSSGPTRMEAVRNNYNNPIPSRHTPDPSVLTSKSGPSLSSSTRSSQLEISLMKQQMAGHEDFDDIDHQTNPRPIKKKKKKKKSMGPNLQTQENSDCFCAISKL
ncbi:hypothetical protein ACFE04_007503 [Oxalis oulophora]